MLSLKSCLRIFASMPTTCFTFASSAVDAMSASMVPSKMTAYTPELRLFIVVVSSLSGTLPRMLSFSSSKYAPRVPIRSSSILPNFCFSSSVMAVDCCGAGDAAGLIGVPVRSGGRGGNRFPSSAGAGLFSGRLFANVGLRIDSLVSTISCLACSMLTLLRRALWISFFASSSTSLPSGARATKSTSATFINSLRIRLPPLSPSRKTMTSFSRVRSMTVCGTLVPFMATTFLKPCLRRLRTSALPSTMMTSSLSSMPGPAGSLSGP